MMSVTLSRHFFSPPQHPHVDDDDFSGGNSLVSSPAQEKNMLMMSPEGY